jgi:hypothetical protein
MKNSITQSVLTILAIAALWPQLFAENAFYSNSNRDVFVIPRDAALAGSDITYSASAAPNCNPAVLGYNKTSSLELTYGGYFDNAYSASVLSYKTPIDSAGGIGASICYLYIPVELTTGLELDADGIPIDDPSRFSYTTSSDIMANVVYGRKFFSKRRFNLSAGARLHAMRRRLPDEAGYGIGLDGGMEAEFKQYGLRLSVMVKDISTNVIYWGNGYYDVSLMSVKAGIGWQKEIPYIYGKIGAFYATPDVLGEERAWLIKNRETGEIELAETGETGDQVSSFLFMGRYGAEYVIRNVVALRGGFTSGEWSFGGGISLFDSLLSIDFAYKTSELDGSYIMSAAYHW